VYQVVDLLHLSMIR